MQDAAIALSNGEYWELTVYQRIALLKGLSNLALSAEPVRDLFQAKAEALQQQLAKVDRSAPEKMMQGQTAGPCVSVAIDGHVLSEKRTLV